MAKRAGTVPEASAAPAVKKAAATKKVAPAKAPATASAAAAEAAPAKKAPAKTAAKSAPASKSATKATTATKAAATRTVTKTAAKAGGSANGSAASKAAPPAKARGTRTAAETQRIRDALLERQVELRTEYDQTVTEITELQHNRLTDSAGDDQADTGTKTFEREQEISLANNILERITQVERALERVEEGNYGWCEKCGSAIPVERLAAFPSATLCVSCKQLEERR
jgi:RNA polymerase-binding protein DksA